VYLNGPCCCSAAAVWVVHPNPIRLATASRVSEKSAPRFQSTSAACEGSTACCQRHDGVQVAMLLFVHTTLCYMERLYMNITNWNAPGISSKLITTATWRSVDHTVLLSVKTFQNGTNISQKMTQIGLSDMSSENNVGFIGVGIKGQFKSVGLNPDTEFLEQTKSTTHVRKEACKPCSYSYKEHSLKSCPHWRRSSRRLVAVDFDASVDYPLSLYAACLSLSFFISSVQLVLFRLPCAVLM